MTSATKAKAVANRGSDTKQGEGWWMASDRKWYPPELHPDNRAKAKAAAAAEATSATPPDTANTTKSTGAAHAAPSASAAPAAKASPSATTSQTATPGAAPASTAAPAAAPAETPPIRQATPVTTTTPVANTVPNAPVRPQSNFQTPTAAPTRAPAYAASGASGETPVVEEDDSSPNLVAGIWAAVGSALALAGSFLTWATDKGASAPGVELTDVSFSGMDSNARPVLFFAGIMLVCGILLYLGKRPGLVFGLVAIACGAGVMGMVFYGYVDITGRASPGWAAEVARDAEVPLSGVLDAGVGLKPAFGLWITALGGFLGAMTGPFLRRDAERGVDVTP